MKVAFYTLGCKLNQSESFSMANHIIKYGYEIVALNRKPEICIINTCTVTSHSDQRCRQMIRRLIKDNPEASIIVTGCYAQREAEKIKAIQGVDKVIGNLEKGDILKYLEEFKNGKKINNIEVGDINNGIYSGESGEYGKTRAFIKIQDGCNSNCSYCIVPKVRGRNRSVPVETIIENIKKAVSSGYFEIVLTGIHIGTYGQENKVLPDLTGLLKEILKHCRNSRIRLSSIEPEEISDELLDLVFSDKRICSHLHIPLQSGSDKILKMMNRKYSTDKYAELIEKIWRQNKDIALGTDIITGFPDESKDDFQTTVDLINKLPFTYLHVFPYSIREGTRSAGFSDNVSKEEKNQRVNKLRSISKEKTIKFKKNHIKRIQTVIIENTRDKKTNNLVGLTDSYLKVLLEGPDDLMRKPVNVEIIGINEKGLNGRIV